MTTLEAIEQDYNFTYPALYKQLSEDGMLSWGELSPDWIRDVYPGLKATPRFLMFAADFEIMDEADISAEMEDGLPNADKKHRFVPFGYTGAGDWYAFYYNLQQGDDVPVALVYHDSNEATIIAKNLQDFIFSQLLEAITNPDPQYRGLIADGDIKVNSYHFLRTHAPYLSPQQQQVVATAYQKGVLTGQELHGILEANINFEWLDNSFPYQL
ncbi:SMI1/KNR4 family protein [Chitinophaga solisilvae]|uniref:SMI1/KNR4 family protein n=1 Tax=Chitinophaga solisilvae TaxID=1233460 RepID=A0A433WF38_9BACT|nr:SMI1/KNR4 family protein [Chitinophaga solisilvae]NSL88690.1 SMI1/KNR4 family protein [Chitinophaga solisilvae]